MNKGKQLVVGESWQRVSLRSVYREAEAVLPLVEQHAGRLALCGWSNANSRKLNDELARLRATHAEGSTAHEAAKRATKDVRGIMQRLRFLRGRLYAAVSLAARAGVPGMDPSMFAALRMGRSTSEVLSWLAEVRGPLGSIDARLRKGFYPGSAAQHLNALARDYGAAVRASDAARRQLRARNERMKAVRISVGRLMSQLRLAIRVAFADDRATLREFRLGLSAARRRAALPKAA